MIRTGKKFSKAERSRVINGDKTVDEMAKASKMYGKMGEKAAKCANGGDF